jgi:RHS repeat-associated protein
VKWVYFYDHANRLTKVERQDIPEVGPVYVELMARFQYDVFGRRIESEVDADGGGPGASELTRFTYDGATIWADLDASGSLTTRRLFGDAVDQLVARVSGSAVGWYLTDHLGSVRAISANGGTLVYEATYDAFGGLTDVVNPTNGDRYGWTGREFEAVIGLQYNRARWYDHATGQWLSEDPIHFQAGDYNLRRYVANNATNATDPDGLQEMDPSYLHGEKVPPPGPEKIVPASVQLFNILRAAERLHQSRNGAVVVMLLAPVGDIEGLQDNDQGPTRDFPRFKHCLGDQSVETKTSSVHGGRSSEKTISNCAIPEGS